MSKPDWKDAPEWANWLAQDANGEWYWYDDKPCFDDGNGLWLISRTGSKIMLAVCRDVPECPCEARPKS